MLGYLAILADITPGDPEGSGLDAGHYWVAVALIGLCLWIKSLLD